MERDNLINHIFRITQISTHTLTWSVTPELNNKIVNYCISTHTLTWSVTRLKILQGLNENFNSHAHVERDRCQKRYKNEPKRFQLTRSRGAWQWFICVIYYELAFQLTRSRGAWLKRSVSKWVQALFQLTRSRGAWHLLKIKYYKISYFNSHAHVERDNKKQ